MTEPLTVRTSHPGYRAAIGELPKCAKPALAEADIVVVEGQFASSRGRLDPRVYILCDPDAAPRMSDVSDAILIVDRPALRPDVASDAIAARGGTPARAVIVECFSPVGQLAPVIADAVGWAAQLVRGPLTVVSVSRSDHAGIALLIGPGSLPVTVGYSAASGDDFPPFIRVVVIGEVRTEVVVEGPSGQVTLTTDTREGRFISPKRLERRERVALRRAIAAWHGQQPPNDGEVLERDFAVAAAILAPSDSPAAAAGRVSGAGRSAAREG